MEFLAKGLGAIILVIVLVLLFTWPTQLLWNWLMPLLFGLKEITLLQALGLELLSTCLFGCGKVRQ